VLAPKTTARGNRQEGGLGHGLHRCRPPPQDDAHRPGLLERVHDHHEAHWEDTKEGVTAFMGTTLVPDALRRRKGPDAADKCERLA